MAANITENCAIASRRAHSPPMLTAADDHEGALSELSAVVRPVRIWREVPTTR